MATAHWKRPAQPPLLSPQRIRAPGRALSRQKSIIIFTVALAAQPPAASRRVQPALGLTSGLLLQPGKHLHKANKHDPIGAAGSALKHNPMQRQK